MPLESYDRAAIARMLGLRVTRSHSQRREREAIDKWLDSTTYKPATKLHKRSNLMIWSLWCSSHGQNPLTAGPHHLRRWVAEQHLEGIQQATIEARLITLEAWYLYLAGHATAGKTPNLLLLLSAAARATADDTKRKRLQDRPRTRPRPVSGPEAHSPHSSRTPTQPPTGR
jgi:hypothetical protein